MELQVKSAELEAKWKEQEAQDKKNRDHIRSLIVAGELPEVKLLSRKQRKEIDSLGINIKKFNPNCGKGFSQIVIEMADYILDNVYKDFDFDELTDNISQAFAIYTFGLSTGDDLATKNL